MTAYLKSALAVAVYLAALGLAGTDEFAEAKRHERINCERNPAPEWCR